MLDKVITKCLSVFLLLVLSCPVMFAHGQNEKSNKSDKLDFNVKTNLQDKYYRQALFYYFQDNPNKALSIMEQNKARLTKLDSRSALFEAGLQLSAGLLQQAKTTLVNFDSLIAEESAQANSKGSSEKIKQKSLRARELRLIALLSLSNQYLLNGDNRQAKESLSKISWLSSTYYQEYQLLNQLAYWPALNPDMLTNPSNTQTTTSPYIKLNEALRLIELAQQDNGNYSLAIKALNDIKVTEWHQEKHNFWKTLFADDAVYSSQYSQKTFAQLQGQALKDYAQLLLAQIYISQEQYPLAFNELQSFPEHSPYAESALFLFAFASQQVKQFTLSFNLLNLLYKNYPDSSLGWQSAELMAEQVSEQRSLAQGVTVYQKVETFFLARQQSLADFSVAFNHSDDLLNFSSTVSKEGRYLPESVWLQQALLDAKLASLYRHLQSIDEQILELQFLQDKAAWIEQVILLNETRKQKIIARQNEREKQGVFIKLTSERDRLADQLSQEIANTNNLAFANAQESAWLARINRSQQALDFIGDKKDTQEYRERLARVNGVLAWQISQQYPVRSWFHIQKLQQLDNAIEQVILQKQQLSNTYNAQGSLLVSINKQKQSVSKSTLLIEQLISLREKVSLRIRAKVNNYIVEQQDILTEHLLSTRQSMAKVLERMAEQDKRLSSKLEPTASVNYRQNISAPQYAFINQIPAPIYFEDNTEHIVNAGAEANMSQRGANL